MLALPPVNCNVLFPLQLPAQPCHAEWGQFAKNLAVLLQHSWHVLLCFKQCDQPEEQGCAGGKNLAKVQVFGKQRWHLEQAGGKGEDCSSQMAWTHLAIPGRQKGEIKDGLGKFSHPASLLCKKLCEVV